MQFISFKRLLRPDDDEGDHYGKNNFITVTFVTKSEKGTRLSGIDKRDRVKVAMPRDYSVRQYFPKGIITLMFVYV